METDMTTEADESQQTDGEEPMDELRARRERLRKLPMPELPGGAPRILAMHDKERVAADNKDPITLAELYASHRCVGVNEFTVVRWARGWWRFNDSHFEPLDDESLLADIWKFLIRVDVEVTVEDPETGEKKKQFHKLVVKRSMVSEVRDALSAVLPRISGDAPQWLHGRQFDDAGAGELEPEPKYVVACRNGIFDLKRNKLRPRNPRLFITQGVNARYNPRATCPAWLAFLRSLWGDDKENIRTLQEIFGHLLTNDTSHQKIFGLFGETRSGKGTIVKVLKALLGESAVANPTLNSLAESFGLEPLLGKTVAVIADARMGAKADHGVLAERLLTISGEDPIGVNAKNKAVVSVRLRTRFVIVSNEPPAIEDPSGALAGRYIMLRFTESFYGREDHELEGRLLAELDGIFRWAIEGWESLDERGYFVQPAQSQDMVDAIKRAGSGIKAFIAERCVIGPEHEVSIDDLFDRWKQWCDESNRKNVGTKQRFGLLLRAANPKITDYRPDALPGVMGTKRPRFYRGIGLA